EDTSRNGLACTWILMLTINLQPAVCGIRTTFFLDHSSLIAPADLPCLLTRWLGLVMRPAQRATRASLMSPAVEWIGTIWPFLSGWPRLTSTVQTCSDNFSTKFDFLQG